MGAVRLPWWGQRSYPEGRQPPLSHHPKGYRWERTHDSVILRSVPRGQEFPLDCDFYPEAMGWLRGIFSHTT